MRLLDTTREKINAGKTVINADTSKAFNENGKTGKDVSDKRSSLLLSAKRLQRLGDELKELAVLQVEQRDEDVIPEGSVSGKFEIECALDSKRWLFNLLSTGNNIIATSRVYSSVAAAMRGIQDVIENAKSAAFEDQTLKKAEIRAFPKWVIYFDNAGKYNFILYASNGNPVVHSHGYSSKQSCRKGIDDVIYACKNPMIEKTYLHHK